MQNYRGIEINGTGHSYILSDDAFTDLLTKDKSKGDNRTTQAYPSECIGRLNNGSETDLWARCGPKKNDRQCVPKRIQVQSERNDSGERLRAETSKENGISDGFSGSASLKNCHSGFLSDEFSERQNQNQSAEAVDKGLYQARPWNFCRQLHSELCTLRQELEKEREIRSKLEHRIAKQDRRIKRLKRRYSAHRKLPPILIRLEMLESGKYISDINASYEFNAVVKQTPPPAFSNKLKTQSCGKSSPAVMSKFNSNSADRNIPEQPTEDTSSPDEVSETKIRAKTGKNSAKAKRFSSRRLDSVVDEDVSDCGETREYEKLWQEQLHNGIGEMQQNGLDEYSDNDGSCEEAYSTVDFDNTEDGYRRDMHNDQPLAVTDACNSIYVSNKNPSEVELDGSAEPVKSSTELNGFEEYKMNSDYENEDFGEEDCFDCDSGYRRGEKRSGLANKSSEKTAQESNVNRKKSDTKFKHFPATKMRGLEGSDVEDDFNATRPAGEVTDCFAKGILRESSSAKKHSPGYLYGCNLCGLKFSGTEALQCHRPCTLSVTGKDPFICSACRATFSTCEELEEHVDRTHLQSCSEIHPVYDRISRAKNAPFRFSASLSETFENEFADSEDQLRFRSQEDKLCNALERVICEKIMVSKNSLEQHLNHHKHNAIEASSLDDVGFTKVPLTSSSELESSTPSQDLNFVKKCTKDKKMFKKKNGSKKLKKSSPEPITDPGKIGDLKDEDSQGTVSDGNDDELCIFRSEEAYVEQPCSERCLGTYADSSAVDVESSCTERTPVKSISNARPTVGGSDCCVDNFPEFSEFADLEGEDDNPVEKEKVHVDKFRRLRKIDVNNGRYSGNGIAEHHHFDSKKLNKSGPERCLYGCSICGRTFSTMISLRRHQCSQNGGSSGNTFFCGECQDVFDNGKELEGHIVSVHGNILFSCDVCKKTYGQEKLYKRHMRKHRSQSVCDNCGKEFQSPQDLSCHMPCSVDTGIQCKHCTMAFDTTSKLRNHIQVEHGKSAAACEVCGKKLSGKKALDVHTRKHTKDSEKPHCCAHCNKRFSSKGTLTRHLYSILNGPFKCFVCSKTMNSKSLYDAHMRRHASQNDFEAKEGWPENEGAEFRCAGCGRSFGSQKELDVHSKVHGNCHFCKLCRTKFGSLELLRDHSCQTFSVHEEQFKCPECEEAFQSAPPLKKHLDKAHSISDAFECKECGKRFDKFGLWNRHFQLHHTQKRYVCDRCGKSYKFLHHLKNRHMPCFVGPGVRLVCPKCGTEFAKASQLRTHLSTCRNTLSSFQCGLCPRQFQSQHALNRHVYRHSGEKTYHCAQCSKRFSFREGLLTHMKRHLTVKAFVCDVCSKTFATESFLRAHVKKVHVSDRPFKCRDCGAAFVYECFLRYHAAKVHGGQRRRFRCGVCDKSFCSKMYLKMHMCSHTGQVPYLCSYCGKGFRAPILLKYHLRMHTGEKPYACRYCFRRFSMPRSMRNHERLHTGEKPYECTVCGMKFPLSSYLRAHQLKTHAVK